MSEWAPLTRKGGGDALKEKQLQQDHGERETRRSIVKEVPKEPHDGKV